MFGNDRCCPKLGVSSFVIVWDSSGQSNDFFSCGSGEPSFALFDSLLEFLGDGVFASLFLGSPVPVWTDRFDKNFGDFWCCLFSPLADLDWLDRRFNGPAEAPCNPKVSSTRFDR